mmetsp:Transcript_7015/g.14631  ORF Transcript_7015/g.14631 Transcript_7015/m.14631 type:complete len:95 (+) Transcript_7015:68-352(+)
MCVTRKTISAKKDCIVKTSSLKSISNPTMDTKTLGIAAAAATASAAITYVVTSVKYEKKIVKQRSEKYLEDQAAKAEQTRKQNEEGLPSGMKLG